MGFLKIIILCLSQSTHPDINSDNSQQVCLPPNINCDYWRIQLANFGERQNYSENDGLLNVANKDKMTYRGPLLFSAKLL